MNPVDALTWIAVAVAAVLALGVDAIASRRPIPWPPAGPAVLAVAAAAMGIAQWKVSLGNAMALLPFFFIAAAIIGAALPRIGQPITRLFVAIVAAPIGAWLILRRIPSYNDTLMTKTAICGGLTAVAAVLWEMAPTLAGPATGRLMLGGVGCFSALCMLLSGCFQIGGYGLIAPAAILSPLLLAWWRVPSAEGLGIATGLACGWTWTLMYATTEVIFPATWVTLALLGATPLSALLAWIPALRIRPWTAAIVVVVVAILIASAGTAWMGLYCQPPKGDYGY